MLGQGREAAKQFLVENPDMTQKIMKEATLRTQEGKPMLEVGTEDNGDNEEADEA